MTFHFPQGQKHPGSVKGELHTKFQLSEAMLDEFQLTSQGVTRNNHGIDA